MENTTDKRRTNGLELKLARVARGVSQRAIASQLGVSPQRVSAIEATYWPTATICKRYHAALASIAGATTDAVGDEVRR
jgi:transcriptional regulator with XRE-family HTH domain